MQKHFVASVLTALLLAACASAPLEELPMSDENLAMLAEEALWREIDLIGTNIKASAMNGTITLDGWVDLDNQRRKATLAAQGVSGVRSVINNIHLK